MRELRILVVEDKWLVAKALKVQLEGLGHRVVGVARDTRDAVRSALRLEPFWRCGGRFGTNLPQGSWSHASFLRPKSRTPSGPAYDPQVRELEE